jgi:hypothetical protein
VDGDETRGRIRDIRAYRPSFVGMVLLVCAPFLIFGAASAYGMVGTIALATIWLALLVVGCASFMAHPRRVVVAGTVSMLAWLVAVLLAR